MIKVVFEGGTIAKCESGSIQNSVEALRGNNFGSRIEKTVALKHIIEFPVVLINLTLMLQQNLL